MHRSGYWAALFYAGRSAWGIALLEILVVALISLLPLLAGAAREFLPISSEIRIEDAARKAFLSGQLIFYAIGLIATISWNSNRDFRAFFPWRVFFNLYCLSGIIICSFLIGYDPTLASIKPALLGWLSVILFGSSLVIYAIITVISKVDVNVGETQAQEDDDLQNKVKASRGLSK